MPRPFRSANTSPDPAGRAYRAVGRRVQRICASAPPVAPPDPERNRALTRANTRYRRVWIAYIASVRIGC